MRMMVAAIRSRDHALTFDKPLPSESKRKRERERDEEELVASRFSSPVQKSDINIETVMTAIIF